MKTVDYTPVSNHGRSPVYRRNRMLQVVQLQLCEQERAFSVRFYRGRNGKPGKLHWLGECPLRKEGIGNVSKFETG